jgi:hypothetical protein
MDYIISQITNNESIRKAFHSKYEKLIEKAKSFDLIRRELYDEKILEEFDFSKITTNYDQIKETIYNYDFFSNKPRCYKQSENEQISYSLLNLLEIDLTPEYDEGSANYPEFTPNQNAINLLEISKQKIESLGITIHDIKVDMDQFYNGHMSSCIGGCDTFCFVCSYQNYRFLVEFSDDCDIHNGILIVTRVYNTLDKKYYKCHTDLNCQNTYEYNLQLLQILLQSKDKDDFFNKAFQKYLDVVEKLEKLGYTIETKFDKTKYLESEQVFLNIDNFKFIFRFTKGEKQFMLIPKDNKFYISISLDNKQELFANKKHFKNFYTSLLNHTDFSIGNYEFFQYYKKYAIVYDPIKHNLEKLLDDYHNYLIGNHPIKILKKTIKQFIESTTEQISNIANIDLKYYGYNRNLENFQVSIILVIGKDVKALTKPALNCNTYPLDYIIFTITTIEDGFNLNIKYQIRDLVKAHQAQITQKIYQDRLGYEYNAQFKCNQSKLLVDNIKNDIGKIISILK